MAAVATTATATAAANVVEKQHFDITNTNARKTHKKNFYICPILEKCYRFSLHILLNWNGSQNKNNNQKNERKRKKIDTINQPYK